MAERVLLCVGLVDSLHPGISAREETTKDLRKSESAFLSAGVVGVLERMSLTRSGRAACFEESCVPVGSAGAGVAHAEGLFVGIADDYPRRS